MNAGHPYCSDGDYVVYTIHQKNKEPQVIFKSEGCHKFILQDFVNGPKADQLIYVLDYLDGF